MAFKAINNSARPDGLILTLLIFNAYPHMVKSDIPLLDWPDRTVIFRPDWTKLDCL
jgi:hypothetical protein